MVTEDSQSVDYSPEDYVLPVKPLAFIKRDVKVGGVCVPPSVRHREQPSLCNHKQSIRN